MQWPARTVAAVAERCVNAALPLDPEGANEFAALAGRCVALEVDGTELRLLVRFQANRVQIQASEADADVTIGGTPLALIGAAANGAGTADGLPPGIRATGDVALAQTLSRAASKLDIDWEEGLARALGDTMGHQLARAATGAFTAGAQGVRQLFEQGGEFVREEAELAARGHELERFTDEVDHLRDDAARLEQRIARLEARAEAAGDASMGRRKP